jgi:hypothetical protein
MNCCETLPLSPDSVHSLSLAKAKKMQLTNDEGALIIRYLINKSPPGITVAGFVVGLRLGG